jgi:AcrR family transcriptional regulator
MTTQASDVRDAPPGRKGRPRDQRIDRDITSAALAVLSENGFDRFSVEEVAARASVAKTTVYRRFPTRTELIVGALQRLNDDLPPLPPPGPVRDRLVHVLTGVRHRMVSSAKGRILTQVVGEIGRDPALVRLVHERVLAPRRALIRSVICDGMAAGELRADIDVDVVIPVLVGPMLYLAVWDANGPEHDVAVEAVVDTVLSGLTPASGS